MFKQVHGEEAISKVLFYELYERFSDRSNEAEFQSRPPCPIKSESVKRIEKVRTRMVIIDGLL
jgi:hypothetical protein